MRRKPSPRRPEATAARGDAIGLPIIDICTFVPRKRPHSNGQAGGCGLRTMKSFHSLQCLAIQNWCATPVSDYCSTQSAVLRCWDTRSKEFGLTRPSEWSFLERIRPPAPAPSPSPSARPAGDAGTATAGVPTLREIQLLDLLDQGLNNEQVADRLSLSVPTVKWHLHNVYVKLGVRSRSAALARARALNLIGR